ncbi:MAG: hypothetical protein J3K34DRAFT_434890 [Monoraphidium minutum]|nr:MAG: hypothetical protein J3K34DRAFT_434890 [Monoraphidium minutum]
MRPWRAAPLARRARGRAAARSRRARPPARSRFSGRRRLLLRAVAARCHGCERRDCQILCGGAARLADGTRFFCGRPRGQRGPPPPRRRQRARAPRKTRYHKHACRPRGAPRSNAPRGERRRGRAAVRRRLAPAPHGACAGSRGPPPHLCGPPVHTRPRFCLARPTLVEPHCPPPALPTL